MYCAKVFFSISFMVVLLTEMIYEPVINWAKPGGFVLMYVYYIRLSGILQTGMGNILCMLRLRNS